MLRQLQGEQRGKAFPHQALVHADGVAVLQIAFGQALGIAPVKAPELVHAVAGRQRQLLLCAKAVAATPPAHALPAWRSGARPLSRPVSRPAASCAWRASRSSRARLRSTPQR